MESAGIAEMAEIAEISWKLLQMAENGWKWLEMAGNSLNGLTLLEKTGNGWQWLDWLELAGDGCRWHEMAKNSWGKVLNWLEDSGHWDDNDDDHDNDVFKLHNFKHCRISFYF